LGKYWPEIDVPVLLNTETKEFQHPTVSLRCTRVQPAGKARLSWSECLLAALNQVQTPLVLYMQEDYFVDRRVDDALVRRAVQYLLEHPQTGQIGLTGIGAEKPYLDHATPWLQSVRPRARYRISTQAALWRVDVLRSYLRAEENGWMFEIFGTWRSWRRQDEFLVVRAHADTGLWPFNYLHTGIVKGQWLPGIEEVFAANGIVVDHSRRGFYQPKSTLVRRWETGRTVLKRPLYALRQYF
jgi:hypothetical protein